MDIDRAKQAIREEGLDGWLFSNFHHRDPISDAILGRDPASHNSRRWIYAVFASGMPLRIVHAIEADALTGLMGDLVVYTGKDDLDRELSKLSGKRWGAHFSEAISVISTMDHGFALTLEKAGVVVRSAEGLIQRFMGLLDADQRRSQERAGKALYEIVELSWDLVSSRYAEGVSVTEKEVQLFILDQFKRRGMTTDHPPIVAAGPNSGNPHYEPGDASRTFRKGDMIQIDLWAKHVEPGSIYADISWVGVFGPDVPEAAERAFSALVRARDTALDFMVTRHRAGEKIRGDEVDAVTRKVLVEAGYASALRHRTGHGIDVECHGSGVNLDSVEFPDSRFLLPGSCVSVEPGLYFADFGLRTEIDVLIDADGPRVTGGKPQTEFLLCGR